ncbi:MAG: hypothetical protein AAB404_01095 [Patescibacteria group bacterium]
MTKVKFGVNIPVSVLKEGNKFVAYSPVFDLSTSGDDYNEVKKRFKEIVGIFLEELVKKGTLEESLLDLGWRKAHSKLVPPIVISQESQTIRLPVRV